MKRLSLLFPLLFLVSTALADEVYVVIKDQSQAKTYLEGIWDTLNVNCPPTGHCDAVMIMKSVTKIDCVNPQVSGCEVMINGAVQSATKVMITIVTGTPTPTPTPVPTGPCMGTLIQQPAGDFPKIFAGPFPKNKSQLLSFLTLIVKEEPTVCPWLVWAQQSSANLDWVWAKTGYKVKRKWWQAP